MYSSIQCEVAGPAYVPGTRQTYWQHYPLFELCLGEVLANVVSDPAARSRPSYLINGTPVARALGEASAYLHSREREWAWERLQERMHETERWLEEMSASVAEADQEVVRLMRGLPISREKSDVIYTREGRLVLIGWGAVGGQEPFEGPQSLVRFLRDFSQVHGLSEPRDASHWLPAFPLYSVEPVAAPPISLPAQPALPPSLPPTGAETPEIEPRISVWQRFIQCLTRWVRSKD